MPLTYSTAYRESCIAVRHPAIDTFVLMSNGLLIVDDDAVVRSALRSFVEADGYQVCGEAANGVEAIERARELQPDLVLLDLAMPRLNGAEVAGILKREMPRVQIILFTMYADQFGEKLASAIGVRVVLSKPEGLSVLGEHLKALLNGPNEPPTISTSRT
jgi:two-component system response regulator EvgA